MQPIPMINSNISIGFSNAFLFYFLCILSTSGNIAFISLVSTFQGCKCLSCWSLRKENSHSCAAFTYFKRIWRAMKLPFHYFCELYICKLSLKYVSETILNRSDFQSLLIIHLIVVYQWYNWLKMIFPILGCHPSKSYWQIILNYKLLSNFAIFHNTEM